MLFNRRVLLSVNVGKNPTNANREFILAQLNKTYKDRCYRNMLVKSLDLAEIGNTRVRDDNQEADCIVDVAVNLTGIIYSEGDIIHNCKVMAIMHGDGIQLDDGSTALIYIPRRFMQNKYLREIKEQITQGIKIPVIVKRAEYRIGQKKCSVIGVPFHIAAPGLLRAKITSSLSPGKLAQTRKLMQVLQEQENLISETISEVLGNKDAKKILAVRKTLEKKFYPYPSLKPEKVNAEFSLETMSEVKEGTILIEANNFANEDVGKFILTKDDGNHDLLMSAWAFVLEVCKKRLRHLELIQMAATRNYFRGEIPATAYWKSVFLRGATAKSS
jgi:hypothetical protein